MFLKTKQKQTHTKEQFHYHHYTFNALLKIQLYIYPVLVYYFIYKSSTDFKNTLINLENFLSCAA